MHPVPFLSLAFLFRFTRIPLYVIILSKGDFIPVCIKDQENG